MSWQTLCTCTEPQSSLACGLCLETQHQLHKSEVPSLFTWMACLCIDARFHGRRHAEGRTFGVRFKQVHRQGSSTQLSSSSRDAYLYAQSVRRGSPLRACSCPAMVLYGQEVASRKHAALFGFGGWQKETPGTGQGQVERSSTTSNDSGFHDVS